MQRKGYGTEAIIYLLGTLKRILVKTLSFGVGGKYYRKAFLRKQNFSVIMRINKDSTSKYKHQGISIMYRQI